MSFFIIPMTTWIHCMVGIILYSQCWITSLLFFSLGHVSGIRQIRSIETLDFLDTPVNVTYRTGELAVLYCSIHNLGTKTVVWRRANEQGPITIGEMTYIPDDRFLVNHVPYKGQWDLLIKNVQPKDEGIYECQVSSKDRTSRRLLTLTVEDFKSRSPHIHISGPEYVEKGDMISLTCNASGINFPPEEIDWFRNGQKVSSDVENGIHIYKRVSISLKIITSVLEIERATLEDDGMYVCRSSDLQLTSRRLIVLNAGTYNVKRDTNDGKSSQSLSSSTESSQSVYSGMFFLLSLTAASVCMGVMSTY
ncbi:hypothetical protein CHS0354_033611 [Potamilus streckersoni]|uniref:Ig-like domain-containing protein n=1 Tax=Potamilus streckersoni TaxID=2493646 RepID=A0AAE0T0I2_9BIVA|nr:hypothetical protein CHS0354_033611 [Potamilus streckersoni]